MHYLSDEFIFQPNTEFINLPELLSIQMLLIRCMYTENLTKKTK